MWPRTATNGSNRQASRQPSSELKGGLLCLGTNIIRNYQFSAYTSAAATVEHFLKQIGTL
jgi:hypothetical protein